MKCHALFMSTAIVAFLTLGGASAALADPAPVLNLGTHVQSRNGTATVLRGDTVWRIAQRYDLPVDDIIRVNNLKEPYVLSAGQRLLLPEPRKHTVGNNDTLYHLSRMYGVTVDALISANGLKAPYTLHTGQVLRIPERTQYSTVAVAHAAPPKNAASSGGLFSNSRKTFLAHDETPKRVTEVKKTPPAVVASTRSSSTSSTVSSGTKTASLIAPVRAAPEPVAMVTSSHRQGFIWPVQGKVISSYGPKADGLYNDGINIAAPRSAPVAAAADGVVAYVGDGLKSYGNLVLIRHTGGMVTTYAHLSTVTVKAGQVVRRGQVIGSVGSTGSVSSAQLHFEVRNGTQTMDPRKYLG